MNEETIKLKDLRKKDAVVPRQRLTDFVAPANQLDDVIGNTSIEDAVTSNSDALFSGNINQRIQRLNDKKNTFTLLNREFGNVEENLVRETQGRGITRLGRRNDLVTNQRVLDSKRKAALADIEDLRGNIETAERLRKEANKLRRESTPRTDLEIIKKDVLDEIRESASPDEIQALEKLSSKKLFDFILDADPNELSPRQREIYDIYTSRRKEQTFESDGSNDLLDFATGDFSRSESKSSTVRPSELLGSIQANRSNLQTAFSDNTLDITNRLQAVSPESTESKRREEVKSLFE